MKQRLVNFSFLVGGHVVQDIIITDPKLSGEELVAMFNRGDAFTTVDDDGDVINAEGDVIGTVLWSDRELSYEEFQIEAGEYEQENAPLVFNASRLARAGAVGEFISEDEDTTIEQTLRILKAAGNNPPISLPVEERYKGMTGNQLLQEIEYFERGLMNLMTIAHAAGKKGQEIV